jgi:hypothetical protein
MKNLFPIIALGLAVAFAGTAIAQGPATPEECQAAGGVWDEATATCTAPEPN